MDIKKVGIVGAGQMGSGIAQTAAASGLDVVMIDINEDVAKKGFAGIEKMVNKLVAKEKISADDAKSLLSRIKVGSSYDLLKDVDIAIEAATENQDLKLKIFKELDKVVPQDKILASNTSSISITLIGAQTSRPDRVIGLHFMNPVPLMKLVEIIPALPTSDETTAQAEELAKTMGKTTVRSRDIPGFIVNRVLMPLINEAVIALYEGLGTPEDIDTGCKLGLNHPMGPLALADLIGLDTCLSIMDVLYNELGNDKYAPCPLLKQYVAAGWLGRKSKKGFYSY